MKRLLVVLFLCVAVSACGSIKKLTNTFSGEDNSMPPTPLTSISQRLDVIELWSTNVGEGSDEKYLKLTPALLDDRAYIADNRGDLEAIDTKTGKSIWEIDTDQPISGGPEATDTLIIVGTQEAEVLAYDPVNGEELWRSEVSSEVLSTPKVSNGIVVIRTIDGKIFALDENSGKRLWIYDRNVPALTLRGTSNPVIDSGLVFAGFDGGKLAAIELGTGKLLWETRIAQARGTTELDRMIDIDSEPVIDAGVIYVTTFQGNVAAVELETGRIQWFREISSHAGLSVSDEYVFVSDAQSNIWALDRYSGDSVWKHDKLLARAVTAPASVGDYVVVGDLEGFLHWMDSATGEFVARTRLTESKILAPPIVYDEKLYAYSSDGTFAAFTHQGALQAAEIETAIEMDDEISEEITETQETAESQETTAIEKNEEEEGFSLGGLLDIFSGDDEDEADDL